MLDWKLLGVAFLWYGGGIAWVGVAEVEHEVDMRRRDRVGVFLVWPLLAAVAMVRVMMEELTRAWSGPGAVR